jgi:hypothetical protein
LFTVVFAFAFTMLFCHGQKVNHGRTTQPLEDTLLDEELAMTLEELELERMLEVLELERMLEELDDELDGQCHGHGCTELLDELRLEELELHSHG